MADFRGLWSWLLLRWFVFRSRDWFGHSQYLLWISPVSKLAVSDESGFFVIDFTVGVFGNFLLLGKSVFGIQDFFSADLSAEFESGVVVDFTDGFRFTWWQFRLANWFLYCRLICLLQLPSHGFSFNFSTALFTFGFSVELSLGFTVDFVEGFFIGSVFVGFLIDFIPLVVIICPIF